MKAARLSFLMLSVTAALAAPATASGVVPPPDAFGRYYSGQAACAACHNGLAATDRSTHVRSAHGRTVTDILTFPASLVPASGSSTAWPSPGFGPSGIRFGPANVAFMVGAGAGRLYVLRPGTTLPTQSPVATVPVASGAPADDFTVMRNAYYDASAGLWDMTVAPSTRGFTQGCACHNLGVTRPSADTSVLANGAVISPTTPSRITGYGVQCEACHGTGSVSTLHESGPGVLAWEASATAPGRLLSAEVCGQCHGDGTARERSFAGGSSRFSSANGYTPDRPLSAFFSPTTEVPSVASYTANPNAYRFYPNGSNRTMFHTSFYNEWLNNKAANGKGHADPMNVVVARSGGRCLRCHSGEGFLERIADPVVPGTYDVSVSTAIWGITCQVCHSAHDPVTGLGPRRSPLPSVGEVDCGDCHNWQFEVLDQQVPSESAFSTGYAGQRVRHPQREMHAGYGLFGVPAAEPFMDGVGCVDCHMPETRDGTPSHRFRVMLPKDATAWGVWSGGDSCTPCHPNLTRSDLQHDIEQWHARTSALVAEATATMDAARARKGWVGAETSFIGTSSTHPEVVAYKKAFHNRDFVQNDASDGAHNPPYAEAGLLWAIDAARSIGGTVSISVGATAVPGTDVAVLGVVTQGDGTFEAAETVELQAKPVSAGGFGTFATVLTNGMGAYSGAYTVTSTTEFRVVWKSSSGDKPSRVRAVAMGVPGSGPTPVTRVHGGTRHETAVKASQGLFSADSVPNIVIASGAGFADALAASGLAGAAGSPLLLTAPGFLPDSVIGEIDRISPAPGATTVWLVGGERAIGPGVEAALLAGGYSVRRVSGPDRYATAAAVAAEVKAALGPGFSGRAFLVSGRAFADALAAAPVAYAKGWPILLTEVGTLPVSTAGAIATLGVGPVHVVGGQAAVGDAVVASLPSGSSRVAGGADRYETAAQFANWALGDGLAAARFVGIASGANFPDALTAGAAAGANGGVVLLSRPASFPASASAVLETHRGHVRHAVLFGGPVALGNDVRASVYDILNP